MTICLMKSTRCKNKYKYSQCIQFFLHLVMTFYIESLNDVWRWCLKSVTSCVGFLGRCRSSGLATPLVFRNHKNVGEVSKILHFRSTWQRCDYVRLRVCVYDDRQILSQCCVWAEETSCKMGEILPKLRARMTKPKQVEKLSVLQLRG